MWKPIAVLTLAALAAVAEPVASGKYLGKWEGGSASGAIRLAMEQADGQWKATVSFTIAGQDVPCTVKSIAVDGEKLKVVYAFDIQGNRLESTIEGAMKGSKLSGKYVTRPAGDSSEVDQGTWETTAAQ
ncbi:MAG: hypothetical protein NTZ56_14530 [Acidobacteria bacterium]|nr:hypothetical protein [Acidobacteriota bacterium]